MSTISMTSVSIGIAALLVCAVAQDSTAQMRYSPQYYRSQSYPNMARQPAAQSPALARVSTARQSNAARPVAGGASLMGIQKGLTAFSADMGRMPTGAEGLGALLKPPSGARNWRGPYISTNNWRTALSDPWGNLYRYTVVGTGRQAVHYITSDGADRRQGTQDDLSIQW